MGLFVLLCEDRDGAADLRQETRPAHLDYLAQKGDRVWLAGPLLGDDGQPVGSMLIVDAADESAARSFAENDPYAKAGLFSDVKIRPYRIVTGAIAPDTKSNP